MLWRSFLWGQSKKLLNCVVWCVEPEFYKVYLLNITEEFMWTIYAFVLRITCIVENDTSKQLYGGDLVLKVFLD